MKTTRAISRILILLSFLQLACEEQEMFNEGDFFYLENNEAVMPVWVKGNKDSEVFIIMLHGGPDGGSSQYYTIFPSHQLIEESYAIVYWDQRMCGMSQGNPSMEGSTMEQFTDDLDQLVQLINVKYDQPSIFLMGHSWGGALGANYLVKHQSKIRGWIEIDGGHSWSTANALSREIMIGFAKKKIAEGKDQPFWDFALNWYQQNPIVGINDDAHYTFVAHANGYDYNPDSDSLAVPFTELLFHSPISTAYFFAPYNFQFLDQGLDLTDRLHQITVPTLLCWGRHDKVFPVVLAEQTYQYLGTPPQDKFLRIFEYSAHSPNYEEPQAFASTVINFIRQYE